MKTSFAYACILTSLAGVAAFTTTLAAAQAPGPAQALIQAQSATDLNQLFPKLFPVFSHPRCINCHGVVQSFPGNIRSVRGDTHPAGTDEGDSQHAANCGECHKESPEVKAAWRFTAPEHMWWVGKNVDQLCALQAAEVEIFNKAAGSRSATAAGSYLNHLTTDPLITQAFHGRAGGAMDPSPPDPPPMSRADFLAAAKAWVDAGAPCNVTGSISQVERFSSNYSYPTPGTNGTTTVKESAKREVQILRKPDGTATADSVMSGHQTITMLVRSDDCTITITTQTDWISKTPPAAPVESLTVNLKDGAYTINFALKPDITQQTSSGRSVNDCGGQNMASANTDGDIKWGVWKFSIRCPATFAQDADNSIVCDPREYQNQPRVSGVLVRKVLGASDAAERQSWLNESPTGTSRADSSDALPVTVRTVWNLNIRK